MRSVVGFLLLITLFLLLTEASARAWYFPEHVVVTKDALTQLPPDIRAVLATAVAKARAEGLPLCERVDVGLEDVPRTRPLRTRMLRAEKGVDCIPYAALPALAGDHADDADELRKVLTGKAAEITTAAAHEWLRFLAAVEKLPNEPIERMAFVHALDVDFYYIDPGYEVRASQSRAHFIDAGRTVEEVVRLAGLAGAVDNALGQFVAHHLRALQLAARGQASAAILEHGMSLHFLEDSFSAGHLVMNDYFWARGNTHTRHRHDYFDAKGLRVRRAMGSEPCALLAQAVESSANAGGGLLPCWTTTGDGSLSLGDDGADRMHIARAVRKTEIDLAIAFDPARVMAFASSLGEREQIALGDLFEPLPWWTLPPGLRRKRSSTAKHALDLIKAVSGAVDTLRTAPLVPAISVAKATPGALFDLPTVKSSIDPCVVSSSEAQEPTEQPSADLDLDGCGPGRTIELGTIGASFLRPILVELPAADEALAKLEGQAMTDHGMAFQIFAAAGGGVLFPSRSPTDFYAPSLGASMGLAYRFGSYLPGRQNRPVVELNIGLSAALHMNARGRAGGNPTVTMIEQELRWPILWELLTSYIRPFDLRASHSAGRFIFLGGIRVREMLVEPSPKLWGVELEVGAIELSRGRGAYPLYGGSIEMRLHLGLADPSVAQPFSGSGPWGPTLGLTITSGYSTFL